MPSGKWTKTRTQLVGVVLFQAQGLEGEILAIGTLKVTEDDHLQGGILRTQGRVIGPDRDRLQGAGLIGSQEFCTIDLRSFALKADELHQDPLVDDNPDQQRQQQGHQSPGN